MSQASEERCCARCLYFQAFPRYVRHSAEGFCRRPEVYEARTEEERKSRPLFLQSPRHQRCTLFRDAAEFFACIDLRAQDGKA